ncbi:hypothetical protein AAVH_13535 [Aphelenchoides avenae]|nr:hypothetical protein AAVH_13535 [Aphelenchus avenae]
MGFAVLILFAVLLVPSGGIILDETSAVVLNDDGTPRTCLHENVGVLSHEYRPVAEIEWPTNLQADERIVMPDFSVVVVVSPGLSVAVEFVFSVVVVVSSGFSVEVVPDFSVVVVALSGFCVVAVPGFSVVFVVSPDFNVDVVPGRTIQQRY